MHTSANSEDPDEMRIMQHFIRVNTVCQDKNDLQGKKYNIVIEFITCEAVTPPYIQWIIPSLLYRTIRKNPYVHKGLKYLHF